MTRIAVYAGGGAPFNHAAILAAAGHDIEFVFGADILSGTLDSFDVFVMPGGGYRAMNGQLDPLGVEGCRRIADRVRGGGMYLGSCAGAYDAAITPEAFTLACPAQKELQLVSARVWNDGVSTFGVIQSPGIGEITAVVADPMHPVMAGITEHFQITHYNGPLFDGGHALATVTGTTPNFTAAENFLEGSGDDELLINRGVTEGVSNIVAEEVGEGRVVLFGSHPEFGSGFALDDVTPAAAMLLNAVIWQETAGSAVAPNSASILTSRCPIAAAQREADRDSMARTVDAIEVDCRELARRTVLVTPSWLGADQAMSLFGRSARDVWDEALVAIPRLAAEAAEATDRVPEHILSFRPPAEWEVDGGFCGIAPLLQQVAELLQLALERVELSYPAQDAYDHLRDSPYHLVAGSYLAAVGRAAGAALLARGFA